ncbi:MFS transporter [Saccharopolyspora flava]|uniref:Predicted arabinose efflux permease, MFS family n=1 Tax=Saccharopolyspora flava TaxID=95161 RepID=A0A1I6QJC9_9PSEU|nr:MFS transporter [Saccharopolyspora flava]SFS52569.1 Predicted arabinose efflux permease, MFS family [Saccharopolyspora flava]
MASGAASEKTSKGPGITDLPREIWILVAGSFIVAVGMGIVAPALPAFATSFDVGVTAAGFIVSAFAMMRLIFAPLSGRLVSAAGERTIYVIGITIVGISSTACAFADSYWQLLVFRALGGIGSTMFTVSGVGLLIRLSPPHLRGRASGLWATSFLLGNISGPIVGGLMVGFSLRLPFVTYGIALFGAAFLGWFMLRKSTLAAPLGDDATPAMPLGEALRMRSYIAALLSNFGTGWAVFGVRIALVPLFVVEALKAPQSMSGIALSVFAAGNAGALLLSGRMADRHGRKPLVLIGLVVQGVATASLGFTDSVPLFLAASLVAGMGAGVLNPAQNAAVADIIGGNRRGGTVLATFQQSADLGAILGPLIAGALADTVSYQAAFLVTGATAALGLLAWIGAPETRPRPESDSQPQRAAA